MNRTSSCLPHHTSQSRSQSTQRYRTSSCFRKAHCSRSSRFLHCTGQNKRTKRTSSHNEKRTGTGSTTTRMTTESSCSIPAEFPHLSPPRHTHTAIQPAVLLFRYSSLVSSDLVISLMVHKMTKFGCLAPVFSRYSAAHTVYRLSKYSKPPSTTRKLSFKPVL